MDGKKITKIRELYRNRECRYCRFLRKENCVNGEANVIRPAYGDCKHWRPDKSRIRRAKKRKIAPGSKVKLSYNKRAYWMVVGTLGDKIKIRIEKDDRHHEKIISKNVMKKMVEKTVRNRKKIKEAIWYEVDYEID